MGNVVVQMDSISYKRKPKYYEIPEISNRIARPDNIVNTSIKHIIDEFKKGKSLLSSIVSGRRIKANFVETQLILLDFDNCKKINGVYEKFPPEKYISFDDMLKNSFVQNYATCIYKTYSHTEEINRYRILFVLEEVVRDSNVLNSILDTMLNIFPTADKSCKDIVRIFFSGYDFEILDYSNRLTTSNTLLKGSVRASNTNNELVIPKKVKAKLDYVDNVIFDTDFNSTEVTSIIKERDIEEYREYLNSFINTKEIKIYSIKDFVYFINSLNTKELFGIPDEATFKCILTEDSNPSASITKSEDNIYWYTRFSDKTLHFRNIDIFKILLNTNDLDNVKDFIFRTLDIEYEVPTYLKPINAKAKELVKVLETEEDLKKYPNLYKVVKQHRLSMSYLLKHLLINPYFNSDIDKSCYLSFKSMTFYGKWFYGTVSNSNRVRATKITNLATYLGFLNKLADENYPSYFKRVAVSQKIYNNTSHHNNLLSLDYADKDTAKNILENAEKKCEILRENGYTFKGFTQDFISMVDSITESNLIFNQTKNKKINTNTVTMIEDVSDILYKNFIENKEKYLMEADIKKILQSDYQHSENSIKIKFQHSLSIGLTTLNLKKKKASKILKEELNIDASGYPNIIIPK